MQPLRSVLMALADRPEIAGAIVVSDDGLVVESALPPEFDPEELAALATGAARNLAGLSQAAHRGPMVQVVVDGADGSMVLHRLPNGTLVVLAAEGGDLGTLLHDLRRHAPSLISLL